MYLEKLEGGPLGKRKGTGSQEELGERERVMDNAWEKYITLTCKNTRIKLSVLSMKLTCEIPWWSWVFCTWHSHVKIPWWIQEFCTMRICLVILALEHSAEVRRSVPAPRQGQEGGTPRKGHTPVSQTHHDATQGNIYRWDWQELVLRGCLPWRGLCCRKHTAATCHRTATESNTKLISSDTGRLLPRTNQFLEFSEL